MTSDTTQRHAGPVHRGLRPATNGTEEYYDSVGHRREDPEAALVVVGVILAFVAVIDAAIRLLRGPQNPGKRASDEA